MKSRQTIGVAIVITVGVAAAAIAFLTQPVRENPSPALDPSIPTITITAKRLSAAEKLQWLKEEADRTTDRVATKKVPAESVTAPRMIPIATRG